MNKIGYIYVITSLSSGLQYVGLHSSTTFDKKYFGSPLSKTGLRKDYQIIWPSKNKSGYKIPSYEEFLKHFLIEILEWCYDYEKLHAQERFWIQKLDTYKNGLNRNNGAGTNSVFGSSFEQFCEQCKEVTKWKGIDCYKCSYKRIREQLFCKICDTTTTHIYNSCFKCSIVNSIESKYCSECKIITKHRGNYCQLCKITKTINNRECKIHGLTKHMGAKCRKCISANNQSFVFCDNCQKITSHNGKSCRICSNKEHTNINDCNIHGLVPHRGNMCYSCNSSSGQKQMFCTLCNKETPHRGAKCMSCSAKKTFEVKFCDFCSKETKHRRKNCMKCDNKSNHTRYHKNKSLNTCKICKLDGEIQ